MSVPVSAVRSSSLALALALLGAVVAAPAPAHAKCAAYAESIVTPEVVGPTPRIVVSIYAIDDAWFDARFALVDAAGKARPLTVAGVHQGMTQRQLELVAAGPVAPGRYHVRRTNRNARMYPEDHAVEVLAAPAAPRPLPAAPALEAGASRVTELGCGPDETLEVTTDGSAVGALALVTLSAEGGARQTGYVRVGPGEGGRGVLGIGHGMCSGEFVLRTGAAYRVEVAIVAPDGRIGGTGTLERTVFAP